MFTKFLAIFKIMPLVLFCPDLKRVPDITRRALSCVEDDARIVGGNILKIMKYYTLSINSTNDYLLVFIMNLYNKLLSVALFS